MLKVQPMTSVAWAIIFFTILVFIISIIVGLIFYRKNKRLSEKMNDVKQRLRRFDNFIN